MTRILNPNSNSTPSQVTQVSRSLIIKVSVCLSRKYFLAKINFIFLFFLKFCIDWFRWDDIHETERTALKEFFDGSSISRTPKIYKEYRDFMINKYREEPSRRLTFTQVRKSLVGDVSLLHKVFRLLDEWGLINFGAVSRGDDSDNRDSSLGDTELKNQVKIEEGAPNGVRVVALPNSLKPISVPNSGADGSGNGKVVVAGETGVKLPPLTSYLDVFGDLVKLKGFKCGSCGEQCNSGCYEYSKVY